MGPSCRQSGLNAPEFGGTTPLPPTVTVLGEDTYTISTSITSERKGQRLAWLDLPGAPLSRGYAEVYLEVMEGARAGQMIDAKSIFYTPVSARADAPYLTPRLEAGRYRLRVRFFRTDDLMTPVTVSYVDFEIAGMSPPLEEHTEVYLAMGYPSTAEYMPDERSSELFARLDGILKKGGFDLEITIEGDTCDLGDALYNTLLSDDRAYEAKVVLHTYLRGKGVPATLTSIGMRDDRLRKEVADWARRSHAEKEQIRPQYRGVRVLIKYKTKQDRLDPRGGGTK